MFEWCRWCCGSGLVRRRGVAGGTQFAKVLVDFCQQLCEVTFKGQGFQVTFGDFGHRPEEIPLIAGSKFLHQQQFAGILFATTFLACRDFVEPFDELSGCGEQMFADFREVLLAGCSDTNVAGEGHAVTEPRRLWFE